MFGFIRSLFYVNIPDASSRKWGLDLIRCIAVLDVVKIHLWQMLFCQFGKSIPDLWPIRGVQLFFVLSGFLIGGIIIRQTEGKGWAPDNMLRFLCRRWFRTLPNYYAVLIANIVLQYLLYGTVGLKGFSFHLFFFTYNLISQGPPFFWEAWTISIEEWFYLLYALAATVLYSFLRSKKHFKPISISIAVVMIIIPTLLRFTNYYLAGNNLSNTVAFRIDGIAYGVVAAWFCYYYNDLWYRLKWVLFACGLSLMFFIHITDRFLYERLIMSILSLGYILCLPFFDSIKTGPRIVGYWVQMISVLSYSIYLLNLGIAGGISLWLFPVHKVSPIFWVTFYLLLLWFVSVSFYKLIERPFMSLREKYYP